MAGSLASINIRFQVALKELSTGLQNAGREIKKLEPQFTQAGQKLSLGLTAPIAALGAVSLKSFGNLEALKRGLESVMGSSVAATIEFEKLKEVAKLPGLGLEEAVRGSVNLQAAGFSADQARESLLAFGNALATVGKGKRELDLVTLALTQLNNKNTGFGQDLRQLTEQLPQLRGALTAAFGTADSEAIAKLGVTGKQVVQLLTKEFAKLPKVTGGFNNALENASDSLQITFAELGDAINDAFDVEGLINSFADVVSGITEAFRELSPEMQKTILVVAGIAAAIGPVLLGIGALLKLVPLVTAALAALSTAAAFVSANLLGIAAIATVAWQAYRLFANNAERVNVALEAQNKLVNLSKKLNDDAAQSIVDRKAKLAQLLAVARDENQATKEREAAIKAINQISPEYLGNLTLETINTDKATQAIERYNIALLKGAKARAAQSALDEFYKKQINREKELIKLQTSGAEQAEKLKNATRDNASLDEIRVKAQQNAIDLGKKLANARAIADRQEEQFLLKIINDNKDYLKLLEDIGAQSTANADLPAGLKAGTIAYYEDQIKALQKLRDEFETTPEGVAVLTGRIEDLQKKIDALNGVRVKVTSVFEGVTVPESQSMGTVDAYDRQISQLRQLQSEVAVTSDTYYDLETAIAQLELERDIKFDFPFSSLNQASEGIRVFGENFKKLKEQSVLDLEILKSVAIGVAEGISSAFDALAQGVVDGMGEATNGFERFSKALIANVIKILASLLSQAVGSAIAGASSAASATGPAAPVTLPTYIAAMVGAVVAAFGAIPKFETGGVVGGSSFFGDKILARVNSGELILNRDQQRNLLGMINPAVTAGDLMVQLVGGFEVEGSKLRLVLDRSDRNTGRTG